MTIAVGAHLPEATFRIMTENGPAAKTTAELFNDRKVVLVGVPGDGDERAETWSQRFGHLVNQDLTGRQKRGAGFFEPYGSAAQQPFDVFLAVQRLIDLFAAFRPAGTITPSDAANAGHGVDGLCDIGARGIVESFAP